MSTFAIPRGLSRRGRLVLFAALTTADDQGEVTPTGTPPSALTTLRKLTGNTRAHVHGALTDLVRAELATVRLEGRHLRVRLDLLALRVEGQCETCGCPARGVGRWCPGCRQRYRDDRAWQVRALELADHGESPRRIAMLLGMPMWRGTDEDGRGTRGGAVVPFLLDQGRLGAEWAERLREALRGVHADV